MGVAIQLAKRLWTFWNETRLLNQIIVAYDNETFAYFSFFL